MMRASASPYTSASVATASSACSATGPEVCSSSLSSSSSSSRRPATPRSSSRGRSVMAAAEHRRVQRAQRAALAEVHVDAAGQARVEAADRAHDVDALEVLRPVLLEDRHVLHGVLV